jgi:hypothetical protein
MTEYLCVLFVGYGVKRRPRRIIRYQMGRVRNTGESRGSQHYESLYEKI